MKLRADKMRCNVLVCCVVILAGCKSSTQYEAASAYYTSRAAQVVASAEAVEVPLKQGEEGRLYVAAEVGSSNVFLIVDSGAAMMVLDRNLLAQQGVKLMATPRGAFFGNGGSFDASVARVPVIRIGAYEIRDCPVVATSLVDWNHQEMAAQRVTIGGMLGSAQLKLMRATIDYDRGVLTLRKPNPQDGANAGQPSGSETDSTSAAAASRRSP